MIYVLSDIHGNERRFASIMKQIHLQSTDTLYVLGDVIDRHPGGIRILRTLMAMPNVKMLLGNHEYMMLRALGHPYDDYADTGNAMAHWYRNGGKVTHDHLKRLRKSLRMEIVEYLRSLPLNMDVEVNGQSYKLVHAAPTEAYVPDPTCPSPAYFSVWKRLDPTAPLPGDYTMIFGHTTTRHFQDHIPMELWTGHRRIGIDCGSGYPEAAEDLNSKYGRLACLRLNDGMAFYSEPYEAAAGTVHK